MNGKILVAHASKSGSTAEVAEAIGRALADDGFAVEVRRAADVESTAGFAAVVLGGPVVSHCWHPDAIAFLERCRSDLARQPVAFIISSMTLTRAADERVGTIPIFQDPAHARPPRRTGRLDFAEKMRTPAAYLTPVLRQVPEVVPRQVAFFAGKLDFRTLDVVTRTLIKLLFRIPEGDRRNWEAIATWAQEFARALDVRAVTASDQRQAA